MTSQQGSIHSINVSRGGVPKTPVSSAEIGVEGLSGDSQRDLRFHGGPQRAVSLYSLELIVALQGEGHPIVPGSIGENLTLAGIDWTGMKPGLRIEIGSAILELTTLASPCEKIAGSFLDGHFTRVSAKVHPGWSRFYARVVRRAAIAVGDQVRVRE